MTIMNEKTSGLTEIGMLPLSRDVVAILVKISKVAKRKPGHLAIELILVGIEEMDCSLIRDDIRE